MFVNQITIPLSIPSLRSNLNSSNVSPMSMAMSKTNSTPLTVSQVIDLPQLLERCMGDLVFAERCFVRFHQRLKADVEQLQESVDAGDTFEAARIAHLIKGSAATIAATSLAEMANAVELAAQQGHSCDGELMTATNLFVKEAIRFMDVVPTFSKTG